MRNCQASSLFALRILDGWGHVNVTGIFEKELLIERLRDATHIFRTRGGFASGNLRYEINRVAETMPN